MAFRFFHSQLRLTIASVLFASAAVAGACSVPVFRYALDHWRPDAYRLEAASRAMEDSALAKVLRNLGDASAANLRVTAPANSNGTESRLLFPRYDKAAWTGSLDASTYSHLIDSPARGEIVKRLLAGESGVWVFLDSGRPDLDNSESARLQKRLTFLENAATLPPIDVTDPSSRLGPGPKLKVDFSVLRIASDDSREALLRTMIFGPNAEAPSLADGPVAAVVFGRGRVLGVWPAKQLEDEGIDQASLFLLGACSCQAKDLNPGWDLLLSVDWEAALLGVADPGAMSSNQNVGDAAISGRPETTTIQPQTAQVTHVVFRKGSRQTFSRMLGLGGVLLLVLLFNRWRRG